MFLVISVVFFLVSFFLLIHLCYVSLNISSSVLFAIVPSESSFPFFSDCPCWLIDFCVSSEQKPRSLFHRDSFKWGQWARKLLMGNSSISFPEFLLFCLHRTVCLTRPSASFLLLEYTQILCVAFEFNPLPDFRAPPDVLWYAECPSVLVVRKRRELHSVFLQQVIDSFVHINPVLPQASAQQVSP